MTECRSVSTISMNDDEYVLVLHKYTHRKRLDSFFWSFVMSMFSRGVVEKNPVRVESLNLKFGPDPEFEPEVMTRPRT